MSTETTRARKQKPLDAEDRYPNVRPDAKYVSDSGQEYVIEKTTTGFFWIKRYKGGEINESLKSLYTSYSGAEDVLISYLRQTDKLNRAYWPGKTNLRKGLPYGPSISE